MRETFPLPLWHMSALYPMSAYARHYAPLPIDTTGMFLEDMFGGSGSNFIGLDESPTGFYYGPIFTDFVVVVVASPTITVGLSSRPQPSLARFLFLDQS